MKKITAILTAFSLLLALAACGEKKQTNESETQAEKESETVTEAASADGFAGVININTKEAWQAKFPDKEIGEFVVHYAEYETGEYEELYFYASDQSLEEWVDTPFNLTGWFVSEGLIVSADGNYVLKPRSNEFFDGCTLEAIKLDTPIQNPNAAE